MVKFKKLKTVLTSVFLAGAVVSVAGLASTMGGATAAYGADRQIELDGNSVFYRAIRGAEITASKVEKDDNAEDISFVKFLIGHEHGQPQSITYRQNLAYTWLVGDRTEGDLGGYTDTYTRHYFSMSLSFESVEFKRFYIKMQSQQYALTKEGKTENYIIFTPAENGEKINISLSQTLDEDEDGNIKDEQVYEVTSYAADTVFNLSFGHNEHDYGTIYRTDDYKGEYDLVVNDVYTGLTLKNVYEQFATYVSSGDTAVTPLTFSAQFEDGADEEAKAEMVLRSINGQSFAVPNYLDVHADGVNPKVADNAPPVMCFTETPSYLKYGESVSLKFRVIDVLASAPRSTAYYYVLTGEQYAADDFDYNKTYSQYEKEKEEADKKDKEDKEGEEGTPDEGEEPDTEIKWENPFIQVSSSSGSRIIRDDKTFNPQLDHVFGLVKIYYEIADVSGSSKKDDVVFVDWYAKEDAVIDIFSKEYKNDSSKSSHFLKLIDDKPGVTFAENSIYAETVKTGDDVLNAYKQSVADFQEMYQKKIEAAIGNMEDGKLYAGGEKFYLPSIDVDDWPFMDDYFNARDYKYSIYYKANNTGSNTSLAANMLAMDLNEADVTYTFTLYITDGFGNDMRYPADMDAETGEIVWKSISASDVWDDDFADLLPRFTVDVSYKKATAENPESLSLAYVKTNYSGVSFKITGVGGTYTATYNLYVFDRTAFNKAEGKNLTYAQFVANFEALFANTYEGVSNSRKYFTTVKPASQLLETDENYELFKAINWNASTLNFTPQSVDDFYIVTLNLKDNRSQETESHFATIAASVQTTALKGENDWLEQNVPSVVLLCVAGVCLIALLVLLIVKPKDKGDIDVVYADVEGKSEKKDKKDKK